MKQDGRGDHPGRRNAVIVGGIRRLEPWYRDILEDNNFKTRIYNTAGANIGERIATADLVILFAGTVSHKMAREVRKSAGTHDVPVFSIVPSSITALRNFVFGMHHGNVGRST